MEDTGFHYRSIGLNRALANGQNEPIMRSIINASRSRSGSVNVKPEEQTPGIPRAKQEETVVDDTEEDTDIWKNIEHFFDQYEQIQRQVDVKMMELESVHEDMDALLNAKNDTNGLRRPYLPTPTDDVEHSLRHVQSIHEQHQFDKTTRLTDIPSSPESYTSETSHLETEFDTKIQRLRSMDPYHPVDLTKVTQISNSLITLLRHKTQDEDGMMKLMNLNDEVRTRSERLVGGFEDFLDTLQSK